MSKIQEYLQRYRILLFIYGAALCVAAWEIGKRGEVNSHLSSFDITLTDKKLDRRHKDHIVAYLNAYAELYPDQATSDWFTGARYLFDEDDPRQASEYFERALQSGLNSDEDLLYYYAYTLVKLNEDPEEIEAAIDQWKRNFPHSNLRVAALYRGLANALLSRDRAQEAVAVLQSAVEIEPDHAGTRLQLAILLATHPNENLRDGAEAAALIEEIVIGADAPSPQLLDALAAAYAEQGDFRRAVATARQALELAREAQSEQLASEIQAHLDMYQRETPLRHP